MGSTTPLPYWQINVPPSQREAACPPFLANLKPKDLSIISTPDALYRTITWPEVRTIIAANRIDSFQRVPSDLRRYLAYNWKLKKEHGSVMEFVLSKRSFCLRLARKAGQVASRWDGGTLICQYGKGVVLPIAEKVWRQVSSRLLEHMG